jgi:hypothetical protein
VLSRLNGSGTDTSNVGHTEQQESDEPGDPHNLDNSPTGDRPRFPSAKNPDVHQSVELSFGIGHVF